MAPFPGVAIQLGLLMAGAVGLARWSPMGRWFSGMPLVHRSVFCLMLAGMIGGNFALDRRAYFPFIPWDIFGFRREEDPITCREFWAATRSGQGVRLLAEQLFPSIVQFDLPPQNDSAAMTHLVEALANSYNEQHPDDPVRQVDLVSIAVRIHPTSVGERPSCTILRHFEISSGRLP